MIDIKALFEQVAVLVLLMVPGVLLSKCRLSTEGLGKGLSNIILYAAQPALIIAGFVSVDFDTAVLKRMGMVFVLALVAQMLFFLVGFLIFRRAEEKKRQVLIFSTVFTNAGYMGIPLLCALFEDVYPEVAIYASVYVTAFNILVWSLGAFLYTGEKRYISVRKMILNPATISTFIGLLIFILSAIPACRDAVIIPYIRTPGIVLSLMNGLKGLVAPLAMLLIGLRLAEVDFRTAFRDKYLYINMFLTLFITPALVFGIMKLLSLFRLYDDSLTTSVLLISAAAPAATATSMFAEKFDGDAKYASVIVSVSSVLCVVSMPLVSLLGNL